MSHALTRFNDRAADYVAGRPAYPAAVLDVLRDRVGFTADWKVVDVGAGTGIASELFLDHGNVVFAVEPNDAMRAASEQRFDRRSGYLSVAATAEATTLFDGCADVVVAAQAFHWFDRAAFAAECRRLLSPRGRVLLMWNDRDVSASPVAEAVERVVLDFGIDYLRVQKLWPTVTGTAAWFDPATYHFADLPNDQTQTYDALLARLGSSSYMPPRDHPRFAGMAAALRRVFDRYAAPDGTVVVPHRTRLHLGRPAVETRAADA